MSKFISGQEIINDLGLQDFEFYNDYVRNGLTPLNKTGQPYSPHDVLAQMFNLPGQREQLFRLQDSVIDLDDESAGAEWANRIAPLEKAIEHYQERLAALEGMSWNDFELPGVLNEARYILDVIRNSFFDRQDVLKVIGGEGYIEPAEKDEKPATAISLSKHSTEKHRLKARAVAAELWSGKYKELTVPEIIETQEMLDATLRSDGVTNYAARTVKDWIKDLCPNPALKGAPKKKGKK